MDKNSFFDSNLILLFNEQGALLFVEVERATNKNIKQRLRGVAEFYKFATDINALRKLKYIMEVSLTKTLANKFKSTVACMYQKYGGKRTVQGFTYKDLVVEVPTKNGTRYIYWGGIPLKVVKLGTETLDENNGRRNVAFSSRTDLAQRV